MVKQTMIIIKTLYYEKRIYYVVGITVADTDLYYPIMNMLSGFFLPNMRIITGCTLTVTVTR